MIKLNRMTEYGLMALRHMALKISGAMTSSREIACAYGLPFEITAKTLQRLKESRIIQSVQGVKGGYILHKPLSEVTLGEVVVGLEGHQGLVACTSDHFCEYEKLCQLKPFMKRWNSKVFQVLSEIRLNELIQDLREPLVQVKDIKV